MQTEKFIRKVRPVEAVQVTDDNMAEVAQWCGGLVVPINGLNGGNTAPYIHVAVQSPRRDSDSQAFVGSWIVREDYRNLRVITNKQFKNSYDRLDKARSTAAPVSPKSMPARKTTPVEDPSGLTQATPEPTQVGAVEVVPGTPAEAGSNLTTGKASEKIVDLVEAGASAEELEQAIVESKEAIDLARGTSSSEEISNAEAHNAVARDISASEVDGDMVQLGQPIEDGLCDECGSVTRNGVCTVEPVHIATTAAEIAPQD